MIKIDVNKAKAISHDIRRDKRQEEFEPYDKQVIIPFLAESAEVKRQEIRDKYEIIQKDIDSAKTADELKLIIDELRFS